IRMRMSSAPPPAAMPMMAPVDRGLDEDEPFAMEEVLEEVAFEASEDAVAEAVTEGKAARDPAAEPDDDKAFAEAPELVEVAEALVMVDEADEDDEDAELEELDLPLLLDELELLDLFDELEDDADEDAAEEEELAVTLVVTSCWVNTDSPWSFVVNAEVKTEVMTWSSESSALRCTAFTGSKPSSTAPMAGRKCRGRGHALRARKIEINRNKGVGRKGLLRA
ncbi:uncharacterized protein B0H18DRAFT_1001391, partial [Fomitopsis serialis]|uniref:uncharacterized protein n=1 Tax=Fomitopsis serialis TaxID=139415 RepID=UPI002007C679